MDSATEELQALVQKYEMHDQLKKEIDSLTRLREDLLETSKHSSARVIVPVSSSKFPSAKVDEFCVAYYTEAHLKHTNEVLVHLGENYYCQRTAHECSEIIDRRVAQAEQRAELIRKELPKPDEQVEPPLTKINEEGELEIMEPYHSDEDQPKSVKVH